MMDDWIIDSFTEFHAEIENIKKEADSGGG